LAHRHNKGLVLRGYPNEEVVGNQLKNDLLYEGGAYYLCEVSNAAEHMRTAAQRLIVWPNKLVHMKPRRKPLDQKLIARKKLACPSAVFPFCAQLFSATYSPYLLYNKRAFDKHLVNGAKGLRLTLL
jgi:hypothetical protein